MKKCDEGAEKVDKFPDVKPGDTVYIASHTHEYFLVCHIPDTPDSLGLVSLGDGGWWNHKSLWGTTLNPSEVKKANLCFKECD